MRAAYHSEYRPGAADTSELDPCIAAETRLKKSKFSTKKKRVLCCLIFLAFVFLFFLGVIIYVVITSSTPKSNVTTVGDTDYDEMESAAVFTMPPPTQTTAGWSTVTTTTEPPSTTRTTTGRIRTTTSRPTMRTTERMTKKDEEPIQMNRIEIPMEKVVIASTTKPSTTTTKTTTTTRTTMRTRPSSIFPTAPLLNDDDVEYTRKTETIRESCMDHASASLGSGVYRISPDGVDPPFDVYCRMDEDDVVGGAEGVERKGGAWTYVQSLSEETYFYNRTFSEYTKGFGRVDKSHWLGLEFMNRLAPGGSKETPATLRIELYGDYCWSGKQCGGHHDGFWWGEWDFGLGSSSDFFPLHISFARHGNLSVHNKEDVFYSMNNGRPFTTMDADHDSDVIANCAQTRNYGGWWHRDCTLIALNGMYGDTLAKPRYQMWYRATMAGDHKFSYYIHPRRSIMMVRPRV